MECPFELPTKPYYGTLAKMWMVRDKEGKVLFFDLTEQKAKYLSQAINSHEKLELLKQASIKFQCDKCHEWLTVTVQEIIDTDVKLEALESEKG